jgi:SNF2 family DNA or RNA helicase
MGLEMSAAGVNIYFSNTFNAENKWQSMERTQSIHQKKPVVNIEITAQNTVDELILAALSSKKSVAQFVSESIAHGDGEAKAVIS